MVNDIIEELLGLDMEPKQESLWWTSTYRDVDIALRIFVPPSFARVAPHAQGWLSGLFE